MSYESAVKVGGTLQTEPFHYSTPNGNAVENGREADSGWTDEENKRAAEQAKREAFERGVAEGEQRVRSTFEARATSMQSGITQALNAFRKEREDYFNRIETEVVQLALAIARKILHRESQIDPLLLTGLVHVALEKLDAGTRVRLRANPSDIHFWNEHFAQAGAANSPELIGDPALKSGECTLETEVGSTQISLETQLKEIEQGFFDLLEQRPRAR